MRDPKKTQQPIIGVVAVMSDCCELGTYTLPTSYVKSLEASGARVVPIVPNLHRTKTDYLEIFQCINGLLIPGGTGTPTGLQVAVTQTVWEFYQLAVEHFDLNGVYFPIWGTCLGQEIMATLASGGPTVNCLSHCKFPTGSYQTDLLLESRSSRMLSGLDENLLQAVANEPLSPHIHSYCVSVADFQANNNLSQTFKIVGTNTDKLGLEFVTMMEGRRYPFYATLSHPEKVCYQWNPNYKYDRSINAIRFAQHLMNFFVQESCRNAHHFASYEVEQKSLIANYHPVFTAPLDLMSDQSYYFS